MELGSVDGVVFADIDIIRILVDGKAFQIRNIAVGLVLGGGDDVHLTIALRLFCGLFRPLSRDDIIRLALFHEVHGHRRKLLAGTSLEKQHLVIVRYGQKLPKVRLRLVYDALEYL